MCRVVLQLRNESGVTRTADFAVRVFSLAITGYRGRRVGVAMRCAPFALLSGFSNNSPNLAVTAISNASIPDQEPPRSAGLRAPRRYLTSGLPALDNDVYLTSVGEGRASRIVNPNGEVMAETTDGLVTADIDLRKKWREWWLSVGPAYGEAKSLVIEERRPDTYNALVEGSW